MTIERVTSTKTLKQLCKDFNSGKLNFDLAIQRKDNVWDLSRKSFLVHSILYGYYIPSVLSVEVDGSLYNFIDGKQRLTSLFRYINGEYALADDTPDINGIEIAKKTFEQLPEDFRDKINDYSFSIPIFKNITDAEIEELFIRLNDGGVALSKIEVTRVTAGTKLMSYVQDITKSKFFTESAALTETGRNRFVDEELVLQILALVMNNGQPTSLEGIDIKKFVLTVKESGIPEDKKELVNQITEYLAEAFPVREVWLKKVNIPILFVTAIQAKTEGILPVKFAGWAKDFLQTRKKPGTTYQNACSAGSAKKEKVDIRITEMLKDYRANIQSAPDYEIPKPKEPSTRGRKKKVVEPTPEPIAVQSEPVIAQVASQPITEQFTPITEPITVDQEQLVM